MSDYTRHLAEIRGTIEARDIRPGDVILLRCPGEVVRTPHTVTVTRVEPGMVDLTMNDGDTTALPLSMPAALVSLADSAELTGWQIGGAL
jgi:hypothetical protein